MGSDKITWKGTEARDFSDEDLQSITTNKPWNIERTIREKFEVNEVKYQSQLNRTQMG